MGNTNNKPPLVFGLQMFIVLPSARGNKQQISQSSRLLTETAAALQGLTEGLLSFKFCHKVGAPVRQIASVRAERHECVCEYNIYLCKHAKIVQV